MDAEKISDLGVDEGCVCSLFVLMELEDKKGDPWLRLSDLVAHEVIVVRCPCGRSVEYRKGFLQRRHRVPSDFLVYDLQFRLRCSHCNARLGFRISIFDTHGDNWKPRLERVVVAGGVRSSRGEQRKAGVVIAMQRVVVAAQHRLVL